MSTQVQQIIVFAVLCIVAAIVIRHFIYRYKHRNDKNCSHCSSCPYADCALRKKNEQE
ncbi:MAG: FeoB-associated Cys-rich membrane protein [Bacteroidaceae bacterium]|nr:FeoB-associated Cys-rich membrane protein [Bacteroidaceae bacterium]